MSISEVSLLERHVTETSSIRAFLIKSYFGLKHTTYARNVYNTSSGNRIWHNARDLENVANDFPIFCAYVTILDIFIITNVE